MKNHRFYVKDDSWLRAFFQKKLAIRLAKLIPDWINPMVLTVLSFILANATIFIISLIGATALGYFLIAACLFSFQLLNTIDGLFAKLHNKETPLWQFNKHMNEICTLNITIYIFLFCFYFSNPVLISCIFINTIIHQGLIYSEQRQTNLLVFRKIGPTEGVVIMTLLILSATLLSPYDYLDYKVFWNLSPIEILVTLLFIPFAIHTLYLLIKDRIHHAYFYVFVFAALSLLLRLSEWKLYQIVLFILPYSVRFSGKLIRSHILSEEKAAKEEYPKPDLIPVIAVLILPAIFYDPVIYRGIPTCYLWARGIGFYIYTSALIYRKSRGINSK